MESLAAPTAGALHRSLATFDGPRGEGAASVLDIRRLLTDTLAVMMLLASASSVCADALRECLVIPALHALLARAEEGSGGGPRDQLVPLAAGTAAAQLMGVLDAMAQPEYAQAMDDALAYAGARTPWDALPSPAARTFAMDVSDRLNRSGAQSAGAALPDVAMATARSTLPRPAPGGPGLASGRTAPALDLGMSVPALTDPWSEGADGAGWCFPWVALTRSDEQRLTDLLLSLKAATLVAKGGSAFEGSRPRLDRTVGLSSTIASVTDGAFTPFEQFNGTLPSFSPSSAPLLALRSLVLEDFPPEVILSAPGILALLLTPLTVPVVDAAAPEPMLAAAADALTALFDALGQSLADRLDPSLCLVSALSQEDAAAQDAAVRISRLESAVAVQDYASGVGADAAVPSSSSSRFRMRRGMRPDGTGISAEGRVDARTLFGTSRRGGLEDSRHGLSGTDAGEEGGEAARSSGWYFLPQAGPAARANVERYYSLRFRVPALPTPTGTDAPIGWGERGGCSGASVIGGLAVTTARGGAGAITTGASLLDSPVPLSRWAGVVVEACLSASRSPARLTLLASVLKAAAPFVLDPALMQAAVLPSGVQPWTGDAAAIAQRCVDAASDTLSTLTAVVRTALADTDAGADLADRAAVFEAVSATTHAAVIGYAQMLAAAAGADDTSLLPPGFTSLLTVVIDLLSSIPTSALQSDSPASRTLPGDASSSSAAALPNAERMRIRRAALARAHKRVYIPAALLSILTGATCCRALAREFKGWRTALAPVLHSLEPTLGSALEVGSEAAADLTAVLAALRDSAKAAKAVPAETYDGLAPAARGFAAFVISFAAAQEVGGLTPSSVVRRTARSLLYSSPGRRVEALCSLAVTASAAAHASGDMANASVELLHALLQHPRSAVRSCAYSSASAILSLMNAEAVPWPLHLLSRGSSGQAPLIGGPVAPPPSNLLQVACNVGMSDVDGPTAHAAGRVVVESARLLSRHVEVEEGADGAASVVAVRIVDDGLAMLRDAATVLGGRGAEIAPLNELVRKAEARALPSASVLPPPSLRGAAGAETHALVVGLLSSELDTRTWAAAGLLVRVTTVREEALVARSLPAEENASDPALATMRLRLRAIAAATSASALRVLPSALQSDPVTYLVEAYPRGDRLPLYPIASSSLSDASPVGGFLELDPTPDVLQALVAAGREGAPHDRLEGPSGPLSGSSLSSMEAMIAAPMRPRAGADSLPWAVRTAAAEQLSHAVLVSSPMSPAMSMRLADATLPVLLQALVEAEEVASGENDAAEELWEDERVRFMAAAGVALDALTAASAPARAALRSAPDAMLILVGQLFFGPVVPVTASRWGTEGRASAASMGRQSTSLVDARLCAARCLARIVFEVPGERLPALQRVTVRPAIAVRLHTRPELDGLSVGRAGAGRAEVVVDALVWRARPLLRSPAIAAGPAALHPALAILPLPAANFGKDAPTPVSSFLVVAAAEEVPAGGSEGSAEPATAASAQAQSLVKAVLSGSSHASFARGLTALRSACTADAAVRRAVASGMATLLPFLRRFLRTQPGSDSDAVVLSLILRLLAVLLPDLRPQDRASVLSDLTESLVPQLSLSQIEAAVAEGLTVLHAQQDEAPPSRAGVRTSMRGRAELLVDSLRSSEYDVLADGYAIDPFGAGGRAEIAPPAAALEVSYRPCGQSMSSLSSATSALGSTTSLSALLRSPYGAGRSMQLAAIMDLASALVTEGGDDGLLAAVSACEHGVGPREARAWEALEITVAAGAVSHACAQLTHPHATALVRLSCVRLLRRLLAVPSVLRALSGLPPTGPVPEEHATPMLVTLNGAVAALLRVCAAHRGGDTFQHKRLVLEASAALACIAVGACTLRDLAPATADTILSPVAWTEEGSGTIGWVGRLAVDRDARVRVFAYRIMAALLTAPTGLSRLSCDPALPALLPICLRHATMTVIALVTEGESFRGRAPMIPTSHSDAWDAETEAVRGACAVVVEAHIRALAVTPPDAGFVTEYGSTLTPLLAELGSVDFVGRMKIALSLFAPSDNGEAESPAEVPTHADALLNCLCAAGEGAPSILHAILSDSDARRGLFAVCAQEADGALASAARGCGLSPSTSRGWCASTAHAIAHSRLAAPRYRARAAAFKLLRLYLTAEGGAAHLPLRLRRGHLAPFLRPMLESLDLAGGTSEGGILRVARAHAARESALCLSSSVDAWAACLPAQVPGTPAPLYFGTATAALAHPLQELADAEGRTTSGLLSRLVPTLASLVAAGESAAPLDVRVAAAALAGALTASLPGLAVSHMENGDLADPCGYAGGVASLSRGLIGLLLSLKCGSNGGDVAEEDADEGKTREDAPAHEYDGIREEDSLAGKEGAEETGAAALVTGVGTVRAVAPPAAPGSVFSAVSSVPRNGGGGSVLVDMRGDLASIGPASVISALPPARPPTAPTSRTPISRHVGPRASVAAPSLAPSQAAATLLDASFASRTSRGPRALSTASAAGSMRTPQAQSSASPGAVTAAIRGAGITPALLAVLGLSTAGFPLPSFERQARDAGPLSPLRESVGVVRTGGGFHLPMPELTGVVPHAQALMQLHAVKAVVTAAIVAVFECPVLACLPAPGRPFLTPIGWAAAEELAGEGAGPSPLLAVLEVLLASSKAVSLVSSGAATDAVSRPACLLMTAGAVSDTSTMLSLMTAAVMPHPSPARRLLLVSACELRLGAVLGRVIASSVALLALAPRMAVPDAFVQAAVDAVVAAAGIAINYAGCGMVSAAELALHPPLQDSVIGGAALRGRTGRSKTQTRLSAASSYRALGAAPAAGLTNGAAGVGGPPPSAAVLDVMLAEAAIVADILCGSVRTKAFAGSEGALTGRSSPAVSSEAGVVAGIVAADASNGSVALSASTLKHLIRMHDALMRALMAAAHCAPTCRALLLSRGLVAALAEGAARRLVPATSYSTAVLALPMPAIAAQLRLIAGVATAGDGEACAGVLRTPRLLEALIAALRLALPPTGSPMQASKSLGSSSLKQRTAVAPTASQRETLDQQLSELRIAAAAVLANVATRKGSEDAWTSRPDLVAATLAGCADGTVGVRAGCSAAVWVLCKSTVRVRSTFAAGGGLDAIEDAAADSEDQAKRIREAAIAAGGGSSGQRRNALEAADLLAQAAVRLDEVVALLR